MNKVILMGRAGRDAELRYTQSGQAVANVSIATSEKWKNDRGEPQERTEWHRLVFWGKLAEIAGNYVQKGRQVLVEGKLQTQEWEDAKTQEKRRTVQVVVSHLELIGDRPKEGGEEARGRVREDPPRRSQVPEHQDEDIPF